MIADISTAYDSSLAEMTWNRRQRLLIVVILDQTL
jgi:hypothetical protein